MQRLLIAATLGLGLLASSGSAFARPVDPHSMPDHSQVTRVDYDHRHYAPPPRHWHPQVHHYSRPYVEAPVQHRGW